MLAYLEGTSEAAAAMLRPGNAGGDTTADQVAVAEAALDQIPAGRATEIEVPLRTDPAGAVHELLDWAEAGDVRFSVGFDLSEPVREAVDRTPDRAARLRLVEVERLSHQYLRIRQGSTGCVISHRALTSACGRLAPAARRGSGRLA